MIAAQNKEIMAQLVEEPVMYFVEQETAASLTHVSAYLLQNYEVEYKFLNLARTALVR